MITNFASKLGAILIGLGLLSLGAEASAEKLFGVTVYKKSQTPRNVQQHPAYTLKKGGDTWFFSQAKRKAQQKDFAQYSKTHIPKFEGKRIDCADVAIENLLNYARDRKLRLTFKVYTGNGARYVDSAQFKSFSHMLKWTKRFLGAHNVTDNCRLVKPLAHLDTPEKWKQVHEGDLIMSSYNKPDKTDPSKAGRPSTVGHTQPIMEVIKGNSHQSTRIKVMNGDVNLATGQDLPASTSYLYADSIHAVKGGSHLSNYPGVSMFKVLQKYNWNKPIGPHQGSQSGQGPLRWSIFSSPTFISHLGN